MISLEVKLNIPEGERWHADHPKYRDTLKYISQRRYHRAIDKLHKLVVQRLFELHKMNLSATGETSPSSPRLSETDENLRLPNAQSHRESVAETM